MCIVDRAHGAQKTVLELAPVPRVEIDLPGGARRAFGADFEARLFTQIQQDGRFVLKTPLAESRR